jgi:cation diffusion facilitator CzcD-associated flavoprotein CzcO
MPRRTDISSFLIIGAGPIGIGQAAALDALTVRAKEGGQ